jgi:ribosome biogenesis GTPase / thiamine phosphate phosphatase
MMQQRGLDSIETVVEPSCVTAVAELPQYLEGVVIAAQANYYWVRSAWGSFLCTRRTRLKKVGQQVLVGDRVGVEELDWQDKRGAIATLLPRTSMLDRPPIANVDHILLLFAVAEPALEPMQVSRFLIKAEATGVAVSLGLNKCDRISPALASTWQNRIQAWGYDPIMLSLKIETKLPSTLLQRLENRTSVIAGPSGVGKSTLIKRLIPEQTIRTGAVSGKLGRGRHTTRHVELFNLPMGGLLADTPGFNQPDITCGPNELGQFFPEVRQTLAQSACQFHNCLHRDEPGCGVRGDWERYPLYLDLLHEATQYQQSHEQRREEKTLEKVKMGEAGERQHEPKLEAKKYRQPSRRSRNQDLQGRRWEEWIEEE